MGIQCQMKVYAPVLLFYFVGDVLRVRFRFAFFPFSFLFRLLSTICSTYSALIYCPIVSQLVEDSIAYFVLYHYIV